MAGVPEDIKDAAVADYLSGMTNMEVARKHHVGNGSVRRWLKERGVKLTPEQIRERQRKGGKIKRVKRGPCEPGCTCKRHAKTNPVVMGHRLCGSKHHQGPRWVSILNFHARDRDDEGNAIAYQYVCMACDRIEQRHAAGIRRRGKTYEPLRRATREDRNARRRQYHAEKSKDPDWLEHRREYQRIWAEGARRRAGIEPRLKLLNNRDIGPATRLECGPMEEWVRDRLSKWSSEELGALCGVDGALIRALANGTKTYIEDDTVDKMLHNEGSTHIWDLYPDLYAESAA